METPCLPRKTFPLGRYRASRAPNPPVGGRSRQTPVLPLRQVGRPRRRDLGQAVFWRGRQARSPVPKPAAASRPQPLGGDSRWLAADSGRSASRAAPWRGGARARPSGSHLAADFARHSPSLRLHRRFTSLTPPLPGRTKTTRPEEANNTLHRGGSPGGLAPPRTPSR